MVSSTAELEEHGLEVVDLLDESPILKRRLHSRNGAMQMEALHKLATALVEQPQTILQELVNAAVRLCGADSAGISVEREGRTDEDH